MMMLPSRQSRLLAFLFALLQLALPGALSVFDAVTARQEPGTTTHIEDTSGQHCRSPHNDECIICRHLLTGATSNPAPLLLPRTARMRPAPSADVDPRNASHRSVHSRAPPEAVI